MRSRYVLYIALGALAFLVCGQYVAHTSMPLIDAAGPIALGERDVMFLVVACAAIAVIPTYVLLFAFAWLFREGNDTAERWHLPDWDHYSTYAEVIWWLIPTLIIAALSVVAWQTSHSLDPYTPIAGADPLEVQVIALDWKWLFLYPGHDVAAVNELVLPVGRPVHFTLTADAPMNSFWIPQLGGQVMVMPGMSSQLWLRADREGVFDGYSANISGAGFAGMHFAARAVSHEEFDAWAARAVDAPALTRERFEELALPSSYVEPQIFRFAAPGLYDFVTHSYMMPSMERADTGVVTPARMAEPVMQGMHQEL